MDNGIRPINEKTIVILSYSHYESEVESDCESVSSEVSLIHCAACTICVINRTNSINETKVCMPYHENCAPSYSDNTASAGTCSLLPSDTMQAYCPIKHKIRIVP